MSLLLPELTSKQCLLFCEFFFVIKTFQNLRKERLYFLKQLFHEFVSQKQGNSTVKSPVQQAQQRPLQVKNVNNTLNMLFKLLRPLPITTVIYSTLINTGILSSTQSCTCGTLAQTSLSDLTSALISASQALTAS